MTLRRSTYHPLYYLAFIFLLFLGISSCRSHRKVSTKTQSAKISHIHVKKPDKLQRNIIKEAKEWLGTPYQYGGVTKGEGCDCSGMVMVIYESVKGVKIPRNSKKQSEFCIKLDAEDVEIGDLVFFATGKDPDRVSHVGIIIDNEEFIHASSSKGVVISPLNSPYYQRTFKMYGRVPD